MERLAVARLYSKGEGKENRPGQNFESTNIERIAERGERM